MVPLTVEVIEKKTVLSCWDILHTCMFSVIRCLTKHFTEAKPSQVHCGVFVNVPDYSDILTRENDSSGFRCVLNIP